MLEEAERSIHDALCVLSQTVKEPRVVLGAGSSEMLMAAAVDELAKRTPGKKAIAMESFAHALRQLPHIIAENGGFDSSELVGQLKAMYNTGNKTAGLNMTDGTIGDAQEMGILESFKAKQQILLSATEAAEMILRVDDIIRAAPRKREEDHHYWNNKCQQYIFLVFCLFFLFSSFSSIFWNLKDFSFII